MDLKRRPLEKPYKKMERRSVAAVLLAFILPLVAVAGYRVLGHGVPGPPPMAIKAAAVAPTLPSIPFFKEFSDIFRKNDTITDALTRHGLSKQQVLDLVATARSIWPHTRVIAGATFEGNLYPNGDFHEFRYRVDSDRYITVYRDGDKFIPLMKKLEREIRSTVVEGTIRGSLFLAVSDIGERPQLAVDLADIFTYDVDFYTDIQKGDRFRILVDKKYLGGKLDGYGSILAAELMVGKKRFSAYRFQNEYYDANGKSLKKSLLKSPLKFATITSRFSMARMHPILKRVTPHEGVDYGAPTGTPVAAVASGRVISAGWNGGFGNSVHLNHENGLETMYSHLSRIDVHVGDRVAQGDVIGAVGATGLATGPHLDFRLLERGKPRDPTKKISPVAPPVAANLLVQFNQTRNELREKLDQIAPGSKELASRSDTKTAGGPTWK
jgi:murein DD-endopeptidase MepM/ murein hydrolase activator NlpD